MKNNYITAVLEEIKKDRDITEIIVGLQKALKARGHSRLFAPVLRGVLRVLEAGSAHATKVIVASEADYERNKQAIELALEKLGSVEKPKIEIDKTIVGGYVAEANNKQIDASYKSKLVTLYRSLTK